MTTSAAVTRLWMLIKGSLFPFQYKPFSKEIQTQPYRALEVLLGLDYGTPADIWSMGCLVGQGTTLRVQGRRLMLTGQGSMSSAPAYTLCMGSNASLPRSRKGLAAVIHFGLKVSC